MESQFIRIDPEEIIQRTESGNQTLAKRCHEVPNLYALKVYLTIFQFARKHKIISVQKYAPDAGATSPMQGWNG